MTLDELLHQPWFYRWPNPMSTIFYGVVVLVGAKLLLKRGTEYRFKRWRWLFAWTDSFLLVGFIALSGDFLWMLACALRFLSFYPNNLFLVVSCLGRDLVGMVFCYFLVGNLIKQKVVSFKRSTFAAYLLLILFLVVNFGFAPDLTWTDWTYAVRAGCDTATILRSLLVSYGLGRVFSVILLWSWWKT